MLVTPDISGIFQAKLYQKNIYHTIFDKDINKLIYTNLRTALNPDFQTNFKTVEDRIWHIHPPAVPSIPCKKHHARLSLAVRENATYTDEGDYEAPFIRI